MSKLHSIKQRDNFTLASSASDHLLCIHLYIYAMTILNMQYALVYIQLNLLLKVLILRLYWIVGSN